MHSLLIKTHSIHTSIHMVHTHMNVCTIMYRCIYIRQYIYIYIYLFIYHIYVMHIICMMLVMNYTYRASLNNVDAISFVIIFILWLSSLLRCCLLTLLLPLWVVNCMAWTSGIARNLWWENLGLVLNIWYLVGIILSVVIFVTNGKCPFH